MADVLIRNIDPKLRDRLKERARRRGRSMSDEAKDILDSALAAEAETPRKLGTWMREIFREAGGVDLEIDRFDPVRAEDLPKFD